MGSLISFLIIFVLSILITKIASQALIHTGLSKEVAQFQARSAFTGVGFTTTEAENIVNHPVRRRIVMTLMLIGNVGIISAMASLLLTNKCNYTRRSRSLPTAKRFSANNFMIVPGVCQVISDLNNGRLKPAAGRTNESNHRIGFN